MRSAWLAVPIVFACVTTVSPAVAAPLITNGSFELNSGGTCNPASSFVDLTVGSACITGWSIDSGSVDYMNSNSGWQAQNGNFSVDMDGFAPGAISQTFSTQPGVTYAVTFWMAGNYAITPAIKSLQVSADGQTANYTFDTTGKGAANMDYLQKTFTFTANSTSSTLAFRSTDNPSSAGGPVIDNVSAVATTPEIGSLPLMLLGLAGMVSCAVFRRKSVAASSFQS